MERVTLKVDGMSCGHCVKAVQTALAGVDGAVAESVQIGRAVVAFDAEKTSLGALIDAVQDAGYDAAPVT
ncbi:MAG: heavy-metal-associated domain-containing protein [Gemmatimonadaceae bacterium]|nr:heavy-metal-associated domain-containing protein [Gemmatimonadaceae bacterium]